MIDYSCNFLLPIQYNTHFNTPKNIIDNLEILELQNKDLSCNDISGSNLSSLNILLNPQTNIEKLILNNWCQYYTNDTTFLNESKGLFCLGSIYGAHRRIRTICTFYCNWVNSLYNCRLDVAFYSLQFAVFVKC